MPAYNFFWRGDLTLKILDSVQISSVNGRGKWDSSIFSRNGWRRQASEQSVAKEIAVFCTFDKEREKEVHMRQYEISAKKISYLFLETINSYYIVLVF